MQGAGELSALEDNAQGVADDPKWRLDDCPGRIRRRSDYAVGLIAPGSGCSGSFRGRVVTGVAGRRVGRSAIFRW